MVDSQSKKWRLICWLCSVSLMKFSQPVNVHVANPFDNYNEKKFHKHFWLSKTAVKCLFDEILCYYRSVCKTRVISFITLLIHVINYWLWHDLCGTACLSAQHACCQDQHCYCLPLLHYADIVNDSHSHDHWLANRALFKAYAGSVIVSPWLTNQALANHKFCCDTVNLWLRSKLRLSS